VLCIRIKTGKIKGVKYTLEVVGLMCSDLNDPTGNLYSLLMYISVTLFQRHGEMH